MTYWGYHLIFTLPLMFALIVWNRHLLRPAHWVCMAVVCGVAFIFTTPWDNYAVWLGVWGFGEGVSLGYPAASMAQSEANPDGLTWLGHIPFEEYSFFLIESILVCLIAVRFLPKPDDKQS
ncbi:lycopene cyclase domain-containing protein [Cerasicoccus fimbriatus]|uniref:lycopene cyclase domain-containing protein n=1 Tax=Cerasicoccus fimbriatus TaxID=3014554 RepID=UPI0022B41762|nr:lycopene cyclase domain-containing protein [Cerasicoccus sp. TK19100]